MNKKTFSFFLLLLTGIVFLISSFSHETDFGPASYCIKTNLRPDTPVIDCPTEGIAQSEKIKSLNKLKNRTVFPLFSDIDTTVTLEKLLSPGNDKNRWNTSKAVSVTGYVYEVKTGGTETCNCKSTDKSIRDTHIELVTDPMNADKNKSVIVEVTPRMREIMRAKGIDWSTKTLRTTCLGRWIRVEGWLLFDEEHKGNAENTKPGNAKNWRGTAWEIHPVTKIEIVSKPD